MNREKLAAGFRRLTLRGLPDVAYLDGESAGLDGTVTGLKSEVALSLYGAASGYKCSFLAACDNRPRLPEKDDVLLLRGRRFVVLGVEMIQEIAARIDLREGF